MDNRKNKTQKNPKTKNKKNKQKKNSKKGIQIKENSLLIGLYGVTLLSVIVGTMSGIFSSHNNPQYFIWSLFIFFVLIEIDFCLFWYSKSEKTLIKNKIIYNTFAILFISTVLLKIFLPSLLIGEPILPTFSDALNNKIDPEFSLGTSGMYFGLSGTPISIDGYVPFKPYIEDNKLFVDVEVYSKSGFPPIKIIKNKLYNLPSSWDRNSNDIALEIVNEDQRPIYQLIYKKPFNINVKGLFPTPTGVIFAGDVKGVRIVSYAFINNSLISFKLKPIFKYPSWRYPGEYKN